MSAQRASSLANTLAPWAEIVPGTGPTTVDALLTLPDDGWVIWPETQTVDVWHPGDLTPSATLHSGDMLDGEDVIPDFRHPIADIFDV